MTSKPRVRRFLFLGTTALWLVGLVAIGLLFRVISAPSFGENGWSVAELAYLVPAWTGLFLPAAVFAGAGAAYGTISPRGVVFRGVAAAIVSYLILAYVDPVAEYRWGVVTGRNVSVEIPLGPLTPGTLAAMRDSAQANPPPHPSFRKAEPFQRPANWWTYQIHSIMALGAFAFLAALLGYRVAHLTWGLSPPKRRNARWAVGLLSMVLFFVAAALSGDWVRASPENSGVLGGWGPTGVPLLELLVLTAVARRKFPFLHAPARSGVI
jgi:hypothetical protein